MVGALSGKKFRMLGIDEQRPVLVLQLLDVVSGFGGAYWGLLVILPLILCVRVGVDVGFSRTWEIHTATSRAAGSSNARSD